MGVKNIKKEWIKAFAVLGSVCIAVFVLSLIFNGNIFKDREQTKTVETDIQGKGLQIYLVKGDYSTYAEDNIDIEKLELEAKPLLNATDIVSYNWDMHCIKIKNDGKINPKLLRRRFVMMADGERIYSGAFWSSIYSMYPPRIALYLDALDENSEFIYLALGCWQPGEKIEPGVAEILEDSRIQKVLERDNKIYKAYKPEHFERPDYIEIYDNRESYGYGGYDWDKKDQLLRLLDQRFVHELDYVRQDLSLKNDAALAALYEETIIILGYSEQRELIFNIQGKDTKFECKELVMPVTGVYGDLLYFKGDNGYTVKPIGKLERFKETDMLKKESPSVEQTGEDAPEGIHLVYYKGGPFESKLARYYELDKDEAKQVQHEAVLGKLLKGIPAYKPQILSLILKFGSKDTRWFYVLDDGETLFSEGKYYNNPALAGQILKIAKEKCSFEIFDTSSFRGLAKAKYSFRTNTRTVECTIDDRTVLAEIEKGFQKAQYSMGGGCPFSDGVLTLTFKNRSVMDISMASDDCPLMFFNGNFFEYPKELHDLLIRTFDNFPYVRQ